MFVPQLALSSLLLFCPQGLEYCGEKYSLDLADGVLPLRGQTSNTKLLSCQTVEKFCNHVNGDESVNEGVL